MGSLFSNTDLSQTTRQGGCRRENNKTEIAEIGNTYELKFTYYWHQC